MEALVQGAGLCEAQWDKELPAAFFAADQGDHFRFPTVQEAEQAD